MPETNYRPLAFTFPKAWEEDTLIVLKGPADGAFRPSLVLRRVDAPVGSTLEVLADLEEQSLAQQVGALTVFGRMEAHFGGTRALIREVGFQNSAGVLRQVQIAVVVAGAFVMCAATAGNTASFESLRFAALRLVDDAVSAPRKVPSAARGKAKPAKKARTLKPAKKRAARAAAVRTAAKRKPGKKQRGAAIRRRP